MNDLLSDTTLVSVVAIAISVLSVGISIATVILTKKTNERDNARIAREDAELERVLGAE